MPKRIYPYKAWVLLPSFKPKEVELVRVYGSYGLYAAYDQSANGKHYHAEHDLHPTKAAAITEGRARISSQQQDISTRIERINKRIAALDKAEQEG